MKKDKYTIHLIRSALLLTALAAGLALQGCGKEVETTHVPMVERTTEVASEATTEAASVTSADDDETDKVALDGADSETATSADATDSKHKADKEEKNGYNPDTVVDTDFYGYKFPLPDYFPEPEYTEEHNEYTYFLEPDGKAYFDINSVKSEITREEFESKLNDMPKYALEGRNANITSSEIITIDGHKALRFDFEYVPDGLTQNATCRIYYFFDDVGKQLICIGFSELDDSKYDYFSDVDKIVENMSK